MKIKATVYPNKEINTNLKAMVILEVEDCLIVNSVKIVEVKKRIICFYATVQGSKRRL